MRTNLNTLRLLISLILSLSVAGCGAGNNDGGSSPQALNAAAVSAGWYYACAILLDGTARCWGDNSHGQLGNGTTGPQDCSGNPCNTTPVVVSGLTDVATIATGNLHTCARLSDGTAKCWGLNSSGQLGTGTNTGPTQDCRGLPCSTTPVAVPGLTNVASIGVGGYHTCALLLDGTINCWGGNSRGQLGNGTTADSFSPVAVTGISTATAVAVGDTYTCALLSGGTVQCWGYNAWGQLGNGTTSNSSTPVEVAGISAATAVATGSFHTCALLSDGAVKCWGENITGQFGNGTVDGSLTPVAATGISTAIAVAAGPNTGNAGSVGYTCALLSDGKINCWGDGPLGNGTTMSSTTPIEVNGIPAATAITAGFYHACAVFWDTTVKCWGQNFTGQLGNGGTTSSATPVTVIGS
jgi:alpha-tubulin suppressor-like RCC1 family protein